MRITLLLIATLILGGCRTNWSMATEFVKSAAHYVQDDWDEKPTKQREPRKTRPRTEKDLPRKSGKPVRAIGHTRFDLHGGVFTDGDLSEDYDSVWGLAASLGLFVNDHVSVGGLIDWSVSTGEGRRRVSPNYEMDVDLTMNVITVAPMVWVHLTPGSKTKGELRPDFMVGIGPALVWAEEEASIDYWIRVETEEDDSDVGFGLVAEAALEIPVSNRLTIAIGGRYTTAELDDLDVNIGTVSGFVGLGARF